MASVFWDGWQCDSFELLTYTSSRRVAQTSQGSHVQSVFPRGLESVLLASQAAWTSLVPQGSAHGVFPLQFPEEGHGVRPSELEKTFEVV